MSDGQGMHAALVTSTREQGDHRRVHPTRAVQGDQVQPPRGQDDHLAQRGGHDTWAARSSQRGAEITQEVLSGFAAECH